MKKLIILAMLACLGTTAVQGQMVKIFSDDFEDNRSGWTIRIMKH